SAPSFQLCTMPLRSLLTMASSDEATMAARRACGSAGEATMRLGGDGSDIRSAPIIEGAWVRPERTQSAKPSKRGHQSASQSLGQQDRATQVAVVDRQGFGMPVADKHVHA